MKTIALPPVSTIRDLLDYDAETGVFRWKRSLSDSAAVGAVAGCLKPNGYVCIVIHRKHYQAHRIAWAHHYGSEPGPCLDHINRVKSDNRIANLREANHSENAINRPKFDGEHCSSFKGVTWHKWRNKWQASIGVSGRSIYLGSFDAEEDAAAAYADASRKFYGDFADRSLASAA